MAGKKDIVEQALKLIAGGAKEAAPKAKLPMDLDNRMYRASEMGFDPTRRYYHLTRKDFDAFKLGADPSSHTGGGAIWLREDPRYNISAHQVPSFEAEGARDIPLFIRPTKELPTMEWSLLRQQGKLNDQFPLVVTPEENKMLRDMGYSHASIGGETVVFDPKDLRSPHAAFDPDEAESADYMKSSGGSIRQGYGPGGWVDDVVKMAGKVFSPEEKAENLSRFVGGSKLLDEAGNPQRLYHITNKDFDVFKPGGEDPTISGPAIWLSPHPEKQPAMHNVGARSGFREGTNVMPVYARMKNPLVLDTPEMKDWARTVFANKSSEFPYLVSPEAKKAMQDEGYDGIILGGVNDGEVIAFEGGQIKSAIGNTGAYDPNDPRIDRDAGGRIAKGPGGWLDDVVKMAGKVISGEGEDAAKAGIRAYQGSPHNFAAERLVRFPEGRTEYIVGQPDVLPDVPEGAEVLQDFPLGRMRMDKIGTGEGAQAYGHGLYLAGNEDIARYYRQALSGAPTVQYKGDDYALPAALSELKEWRTANPEGSAYLESLRKKTMEDATKILLENVGGGSDAPGVLRNLVNSFPSAAQDTAKGWVEQAEKLIKPHLAVDEPGSMYEVRINADPNTFLDWDKPLSEQPRHIQAILGDRGVPVRPNDPLVSLIVRKAERAAEGEASQVGMIIDNDQTLYNQAMNHARRNNPQAFEAIQNGEISPGDYVQDIASDYIKAASERNKPAGEFYKNLEQQLGADVMRRKATEAGIPGIKYLDAGSRGAGDGTRNYVVFDDKLISIIRKYGIAGASAMLGYNLMEQLDPKQALAASMADQDYQASRPRQSAGGNNAVSGAVNVARGLNGVK